MVSWVELKKQKETNRKIEALEVRIKNLEAKLSRINYRFISKGIKK